MPDKPLYHEEALEELRQATLYGLEKWSPDLVSQLQDEFALVVGEILADPERRPVIRHGARRSNLRRFPYHVIYALLDDGQIWIVAFAHDRQLPFYWKDRL